MRILTFPSPPISLSTAHILTALFAASYVGSIYLSKNARLSFSAPKHLHRVIYTNNRGTANGWPRERAKQHNERWRDDPDVIKARLVAVSLAALGCCTLLFCVAWWLIRPSEYKTELTIDTVLARLGLTYNTHYPLSHLPILLLFIGPIYCASLAENLPLQRHWNFSTHLLPLFGSWQGVRNFIVAPITEEIVFRGCVLAVYHLAGAGKMRMVFLSPLSFGLAHVHHAWDTYNRYGRGWAAAQRAVLMSLFQLGYTTLFGFYASYLFLRTCSIYPSITAHVFCNIMGLPDISGELRSWPSKRKTILTMYSIGMLLFAYTARVWTRVENSVYWTGVDVDGVVGW